MKILINVCVFLVLSLSCFGQEDSLENPAWRVLKGSDYFKNRRINRTFPDHDSLWWDSWKLLSHKILGSELIEDYYDSLCFSRKHVPKELSRTILVEERISHSYPLFYDEVVVVRDYPDVSFTVYYRNIQRYKFACRRCGSIKRFIYSSRIDSFPVWRKNK